jgi:hypothetical protein
VKRPTSVLKESMANLPESKSFPLTRGPFKTSPNTDPDAGQGPALPQGLLPRTTLRGRCRSILQCGIESPRIFLEFFHGLLDVIDLLLALIDEGRGSRNVRLSEFHLPLKQLVLSSRFVIISLIVVLDCEGHHLSFACPSGSFVLFLLRLLEFPCRSSMSFILHPQFLVQLIPLHLPRRVVGSVASAVIQDLPNGCLDLALVAIARVEKPVVATGFFAAFLVMHAGTTIHLVYSEILAPSRSRVPAS